VQETRLWPTLALLIFAAVDGLTVIGSRHLFATIGIVTATVGVAVEVVTIRQTGGHSHRSAVFSPRAASVGGVLLALASLLCYTVLFSGLGALFAMIAAIILVQSSVQPLHSDAILAGALSILPVILGVWVVVAANRGYIIQAAGAGCALVATIGVLAWLRRRSIAARSVV
jgi:hypothetical protein